MKHSHHLHSKKGAASALIILLLVLLVFFGVLALVTAAAELRLAARRAEWSLGYYQVDSRAQQVLARISRICHETDCGSEGFAGPSGVLAVALADEPVENLVVTPVDEDGRFRVEARVLASADAAQGIDLELVIQPSRAAEKPPRIEIVRWSWWRVPFDYDAQADSYWGD